MENGRPKASRILEYLLEGKPIKKDDHIYYLSDDNYLCEEMDKHEGDKYIGKTLVKVNFGGFGLNDFIKWGETFSDADVFIMGCEKVLTDIHRRKRG